MGKVLCMEVGVNTVRLAEVNKRGKVAEVTKIYVFDTPDDATKDGKVRVSDSVVASIKDGLDASGIKALDVYFVVESPKILYKQAIIPMVPKRMIQETLTLAMTEWFPSVDETLYHVSYVVERSFEKNGQKMLAIDVFAIPNDLSESYYNLAVALGLNAKGLTDTSRSMVSLFNTSFQNRNVAMVNMNEHSSTLTIVTDGDMVFNKTIAYGVNDAIRQVMNSSLTMGDIEVSDAIELLCSQNILLRQLPTDGVAADATDEYRLRYNATSSIVSLVKQFEQTFTAYLAKEKIQIQEFHISGIGAGFAGIGPLLTAEFGLPVRVIQQEGNLRVNKTVADEQLLLTCYPCVGACIDDANFFTAAEKAGGELAQRRKIDRLVMLLGCTVCVSSLAYGAYSWLQANLAYQDAKEENTHLKRRVQELRDLGVEIAFNDYETAMSYNQEVQNLYNGTRSENEEMTVFLEELERTLPSSARVMSISMTPTYATVQFSCADKNVAAGTLHLLRNMKTTNSMDCASVGEDSKTGVVSFKCTFSIKTSEQLKAESDANGNNTENGNDTENENNTENENTNNEQGQTPDESLPNEPTEPTTPSQDPSTDNTNPTNPDEEQNANTENTTPSETTNPDQNQDDVPVM